MPSSQAHYRDVLAPVYTWMLGGFDAARARNAAFFAAHRVGAPAGTGVAVDLGAGSGCQSIPLAELGYRVTAIDLDTTLLAELVAHAGTLPIRVVEADLTRLTELVAPDVELAVCMTDTLLHLPTREVVCGVLADVYSVLAPGGRLILTFRDLTPTLEELDRFIPVRSDADTVFTCFLEYEPETVKVHDLVYRRGTDGAWSFYRSFYRKLRLAPGWVGSALERVGFGVDRQIDRGLVTIVATKPVDA